MKRMMWKGITAAALLINVFVMPYPVQAENGKHNPTEVINVGFFAFDGYHMEDASGAKSGYGYDFLQKMGNYAGWTYNYVGYDKSWSDMQEMLLDGTIDMVTSAQKTEERSQKFAFSDEPIGTNYAILTAKSGNQKYTAGDYTTYNGMRIGELSSSSRNNNLNTFAEEKGFTFTTVLYPDTATMTAALQNDQVDALLTSNLRVITNEWILDQFDSSDFYVMVRKDRTDLLNRVNQAITELDNNYPDWRTVLWNKYYQVADGKEIAFTAEERAYIKSLSDSQTKLQVIVNPDRIPYSYISNGEVKGIMPEVLKKIEEATGLSFEIVETADRAAYGDMLSSDKHIDVKLDTYNDLYRAEQAGYKLTDTYLTVNIDKVTGKTDSDTVAITSYGDMTDLRRDILASGVPLLYCDTFEECVKAVLDGKAGVTYLYTYTAQYYMDSDTTGSLKAVTMPQYINEYCLGVAVDDDPKLLSILDKAVNHIQGDITQQIILDQTKSTTYSLTFTEFMMQNPVLALSLFAVAGLMLGLIVLSFYRRRSLRLIAQKNTELENAIQEAEKANAAKSAFLSSMSHDMRTPLNGIIGFTDFAIRTSDIKQKQDYLEKVQRSSLVLQNLVNDTLNVSRIESGKAALNPEYANTKDIYDSLTLVIASAAREKDITFTSTSEVPENISVYIDKMKLQEIFMNLLSNAVKYTPDHGKVWFDVEYTKIEENKGQFKFTVKDNGIGMSKEFQQTMYEPFVQEHPVQNRNAGTGLGLYICKQYVDLMHGTIEVESDTGKGTTFVVILTCPIKLEDPQQMHHEHPNYDFKGVHCLLVEDNLFNQEITKTLLAEKGADVTIADNGREAVDIFTNSFVGYFTVILMDIHMPVMGGLEATRTIRQLSREDAKTVPIIALTADAYDQDVKTCLGAGMNAHIAKPISPEYMYDVINEFVDPHNSRKVN